MFSHLNNFALRRDGKQAIGFYIAYFVLTVILAIIAGSLVGGANGPRVGNTVAIAVGLILSYLILKAKGLVSNISYLILLVSAGVLAYFGGALLGMIPVAYLTTRK